MEKHCENHCKKCAVKGCCGNCLYGRLYGTNEFGSPIHKLEVVCELGFGSNESFMRNKPIITNCKKWKPKYPDVFKK